jgi:hypothetical protein
MVNYTTVLKACQKPIQIFSKKSGSGCTLTGLLTGFYKLHIFVDNGNVRLWHGKHDFPKRKSGFLRGCIRGVHPNTATCDAM